MDTVIRTRTMEYIGLSIKEKEGKCITSKDKVKLINKLTQGDVMYIDNQVYVINCMLDNYILEYEGIDEEGYEIDLYDKLGAYPNNRIDINILGEEFLRIRFNKEDTDLVNYLKDKLTKNLGSQLDIGMYKVTYEELDEQCKYDKSIYNRVMYNIDMILEETGRLEIINDGEDNLSESIKEEINKVITEVYQVELNYKEDISYEKDGCDLLITIK